MAPRHFVAAIVFGVAIGLIMNYVMGGELLIHVAIAVLGALAGTWFAVRNKAR